MYLCLVLVCLCWICYCYAYKYVYCVLVYIVFFLFFFFKQKTAYEMRISDWSSDVCSSDLIAIGFIACVFAARGGRPTFALAFLDGVGTGLIVAGLFVKIGRASCRERVCQYV